MGKDTVEINNILRQIELLYQAAARHLEIYARTGNEGVLKQGRELLNQANQLIDRHIVPIVQSLNPSQVTQQLMAAGVSPQVVQQVGQAVILAQGAIVSGALTTAEICAIINIAVPILWVLIALAVLGFLYKKWLESRIEKESQRLVQEMERRVYRPKHEPFKPRFIPGRI